MLQFENVGAGYGHLVQWEVENFGYGLPRFNPQDETALKRAVAQSKINAEIIATADSIDQLQGLLGRVGLLGPGDTYIDQPLDDGSSLRIASLNPRRHYMDKATRPKEARRLTVSHLSLDLTDEHPKNRRIDTLDALIAFDWQALTARRSQVPVVVADGVAPWAIHLPGEAPYIERLVDSTLQLKEAPGYVLPRPLPPNRRRTMRAERQQYHAVANWLLDTLKDVSPQWITNTTS